MTGHFLTIDFLPDPFESDAVRVAAAAETDGGLVVVRRRDLTQTLNRPDQEMVDLGIRSLEQEGMLVRPERLGPQFEFSIRQDIPEAIARAGLREWLEQRVHEPTPLRSIDVPQADDLARVVKVALSLPRAFEDVTPRQWAYYRHAARTLGLVDARAVEPTERGLRLARRGLAESIEELRQAFADSRCGREWLTWCGVSEIGQLPADTAVLFLRDRVPSIAEATRVRRAESLERWRKELR